MKRDFANIRVQVPRQPNYCDCGVYLLCYVEGFLHAAEAFAQEFLQRVDCQGRFDDMKFTGKRQELRELIIHLHEEQHGDQGKNDVANGRVVEAQARPNSRRAPSEEIQEVRHEEGGPRPVECGAAMEESGPRPEISDQAIMDLVNTIQSRQSTGIQSRRFTPAPEIERQAGLGPTSSSHFSHVEILNKARASSPASLQSSSPCSVDSKFITKEPWHAPLRAQKSPSDSQNDDYTTSVDQDFGATVPTEF